MMNKIGFIALFQLLALFASGQEIEYGIKAGLNSSIFDNEGNEFDDFESKLGPVLGGFGVIRINQNVGIRAELLYSMEGTKFEFDDDAFVTLHRVALPLLLSYQVYKNLNIELGPEIKALVGFDTRRTSYDKSLFETLDFGLSLGVEFKPIDKIGIALRNYFGLNYQNEIIITDQTGNQIDVIKSDRINVLTLGINYYLN